MGAVPVDHLEVADMIVLGSCTATQRKCMEIAQCLCRLLISLFYASSYVHVTVSDPKNNSIVATKRIAIFIDVAICGFLTPNLHM